MAGKNLVWITLQWERDVLATSAIAQGERFVLGDGPGAWPFPPELLGAPSLTVVDYTGNQPQLHTPEGSVVLELERRRSVEFGPFRVLVFFGVTARKAVFSQPQRFDFRPLAYFAASAASQLLILMAAVYSVPELTREEPLPSREELSPFIQAFAGTEAEPEVAPDELIAAIAEQVYPTIQAIRGNSRCGGETDMGTVHTRKAGRYAVMGPRDNPDPHLSRWLDPQKKVVNVYPEPNPVGVLEPYPLTNTEAPVAAWGRDSSLGTDEVSARGNMWGDEIDIGAGDEESLGLTHLDGGKVKRIEPTRPSNDSSGSPPRVLHTQLHVHGELEPQAIESRLMTRLESLRRCFGEDPASRGDHEGRVDLSFEVDQSGALQHPQALRIKRVDPGVVTCMLKQVEGLSFEPSSGKTEVIYPLLLIPGTGEVPQAMAQLSLAPEITRSNEPVVPCSGPSKRHPRRSGNCPR